MKTLENTKTNETFSDLTKTDLKQIRASRSSNISELAGLIMYLDNKKIHSYKVTNISETGFAASISDTLIISENLEVEIHTKSGQEIYKGFAKKAWAQKNSAGFAFIDRFLSEALLTHLEICHFIAETVQSSLDVTSSVPIEFRDTIFRFSRFLKHLHESLEQQDQKNLRLGGESKIAFDEALKLVFSTTIIPTMRAFNSELDKLLSNIKDRSMKNKIITVFREELNQYLTQGPFANRALHKPLGYAGDYEMMNQIYSESLEGLSSFSKLIHLYGITEHSSISVLERRKLVAEKLVNLISSSTNKIKIAAIACGPAKEVLDTIENTSSAELEQCEFYLIDQDIEALLNAKRNITTKCIDCNKKVNVNYLQVSVKDILEKKTASIQLSNLGFDFIYTMGLYDYLTQPVAKYFTNEMVSWLKQNGILFIGNFNPKNPTKTISELSVDWKLIHRTDEEMIDLVPNNGIRSHKITHDRQDIEVFLEIIK